MTDTSLESALDELITLLDTCDEQYWAGRLGTDLRLITQGDDHGLDRLLQSFGGMGGLMDLVIHPVNGHRVAEADVDEVNRQVVALVDEVAGRARALAHVRSRER